MSRNIARFFHFSLETEFNALRFINYRIPRLCSTYAVEKLISRKGRPEVWATFNWRSIPALYIVPRKYRAGPKSIQTHVPFHPAAGRNPDWSIIMIFMRLMYQSIPSLTISPAGKLPPQEQRKCETPTPGAEKSC